LQEYSFLLFFTDIKNLTNAPGIVFRQNKGREKMKKSEGCCDDAEEGRGFRRTEMLTVYEVVVVSWCTDVASVDVHAWSAWLR
jgi:hypothetical protein